MKVGVIVPQGWTGEYEAWSAVQAWDRTVEIARQAEALGFDSLWAFDHFHTTPKPTDELTFESFTMLAALAALTERARIGHIVACAGFRNPALTAKMVSTIDVISGGRATLGIGAGWKQEEWVAYGYHFPSTRERLDILQDQLEIITRMFGAGRAEYAGEHASVAGAINEPKGAQVPAIPIVVGGNGRERTWRLAARFADELNLDAVAPGDLPEAMEIIADRCREVDRDPRSLAVSVHVWWEHLPPAGAQRRAVLAAYRDAGIDRIQTLARGAVLDDQWLSALAADAEIPGPPPEGRTAA